MAKRDALKLSPTELAADTREKSKVNQAKETPPSTNPEGIGEVQVEITNPEGRKGEALLVSVDSESGEQTVARRNKSGNIELETATPAELKESNKKNVTKADLDRTFDQSIQAYVKATGREIPAISKKDRSRMIKEAALADSPNEALIDFIKNHPALSEQPEALEQNDSEPKFVEITPDAIYSKGAKAVEKQIHDLQTEMIVLGSKDSERTDQIMAELQRLETVLPIVKEVDRIKDDERTSEVIQTTLDRLAEKQKGEKKKITARLKHRSKQILGTNGLLRDLNATIKKEQQQLNELTASSENPEKAVAAKSQIDQIKKERDALQVRLQTLEKSVMELTSKSAALEKAGFSYDTLLPGPDANLYDELNLQHSQNSDETLKVVEALIKEGGTSQKVKETVELFKQDLKDGNLPEVLRPDTEYPPGHLDYADKTSDIEEGFSDSPDINLPYKLGGAGGEKTKNYRQLKNSETSAAQETPKEMMARMAAEGAVRDTAARKESRLPLTEQPALPDNYVGNIPPEIQTQRYFDTEGAVEPVREFASQSPDSALSENLPIRTESSPHIIKDGIERNSQSVHVERQPGNNVVTREGMYDWASQLPESSVGTEYVAAKQMLRDVKSTYPRVNPSVEQKNQMEAALYKVLALEKRMKESPITQEPLPENYKDPEQKARQMDIVTPSILFSHDAPAVYADAWKTYEDNEAAKDSLISFGVPQKVMDRAGSLKELTDMADKAGFFSPTGKKVREALNRFVEQAAIAEANTERDVNGQKNVESVSERSIAGSSRKQETMNRLSDMRPSTLGEKQRETRDLERTKEEEKEAQKLKEAQDLEDQEMMHLQQQEAELSPQKTSRPKGSGEKEFFGQSFENRSEADLDEITDTDIIPADENEHFDTSFTPSSTQSERSSREIINPTAEEQAEFMRQRAENLEQTREDDEMDDRVRAQLEKNAQFDAQQSETEIDLNTREFRSNVGGIKFEMRQMSDGTFVMELPQVGGNVELGKNLAIAKQAMEYAKQYVRDNPEGIGKPENIGGILEIAGNHFLEIQNSEHIARNETVNGLDISMTWDNERGNYVINVPGSSEKVSVGRNTNEAASLFDQVIENVKLAEDDEGVDFIFNEIASKGAELYNDENYADSLGENYAEIKSVKAAFELLSPQQRIEQGVPELWDEITNPPKPSFWKRTFGNPKAEQRKLFDKLKGLANLE